MTRQIPLHLYPPRAAAWRRLGILIWCVLLALAIGNVWVLAPLEAEAMREQGINFTTITATIACAPLVWPFVLWTIVRWVVGGFWTLKP